MVDPLDGSTNATLGLPWFATSLCLVVEGVPAASMVTNLATGEWFSAVAGEGATSDVGPIEVRPMVTLDESIIAVQRPAVAPLRLATVPCDGRFCLDICAVARGAFDAFADLSPDAHGVWDYAGALLIVQEAGGVIVDALGRDLVVLDHDARRTPVAASSQALLESLVAAATR